MKADEWKNFVLIYSLFSLKNIIPASHYLMWSLFVAACKCLCVRTINATEVDQAHMLLKMFCKKFVELFGKEHCTPNMHLHMHLKDCVENFGPVYAFWCFGFERFNGILGSFHVNNHSISIQFMRKYISGFDSMSALDIGTSKKKIYQMLS